MGHHPSVNNDDVERIIARDFPLDLHDEVPPAERRKITNADHDEYQQWLRSDQPPDTAE